MTIPIVGPDSKIVSAVEIGDEPPTALYRLYNSKRKLLYVGITGNLKARLAAHADTKLWWPEVSRKTVEWHLTREGAAVAELKAIQAERPIHNVRGFIVPPSIRPQISGEDVYALAVTKMPPSALRLALLELAGMMTKEALDVLRVSRPHRYRVINERSAALPVSQKKRDAA
jgi:predicted GIY-YIG superfamily endonuclease